MQRADSTLSKAWKWCSRLRLRRGDSGKWSQTQSPEFTGAECDVTYQDLASYKIVAVEPKLLLHQACVSEGRSLGQI